MAAATVAVRYLALGSYFCLLALVIAWNVWLEPSQRFPRALVLLVMASPLLFALRGMLHGKPYTHAWTSFLALAYFAHGVTEGYVDAADRPYAGMEVLFSVTLFLGCVLYTRLRSREIRAE